MTMNELKNLPGERVLSLFGLLLLQIGGLGVTLFWAFGLFLLLGKIGGGQIHYSLIGADRGFFYMYPVALIIFSIAGWLAFVRRNDLFALAMMSAPVGLVVLFYLYTILRPQM